MSNNESFYKSLFKNNKEIMLLINSETTEIEDCNIVACDFYGYSFNEMLKLKITDLNILTEDQVRKEIDIARQEKRNYFYFKHRLSNGQVKDVEVHSTPVNIKGKNLLLSIISDTTNINIYNENLKVENVLLQKTVAERTYKLEEINQVLDKANDILTAILESSPEIIVFALDCNYRYIAFNKKHKDTMKAIWGKEIEIGMNMLDVIGRHQDSEKAKINFDRALSGESFTLIEEYGDENISRMFWQDFWSPILSKEGKVIGLTCFVLNITELKKAEKVLNQEKAFSEALFESIPGYLYVYNQKGKLIRWNKKHEEMTGYSADELSHMSMQSWFEGEDKVKVAEAVEKVLTTGSGDVEAHLIVKDGSKIHIHSNGVRLIMDGETYFTGVGIDITERKKHEEALRESERQFRVAVDEAPVPIMLHAEGGEVIKISRTWADITGYTLEDIKTTEIWAARAYGEKKQEVIPVINSLYDLDKRQYDGMYTVTTKDGNTLLWDFYSAYIGKLQDGRKMVMSVAIDVTEHKKLEAALANEKMLLETTLISVGDGVISTDREGNVVFLNKVAEKLTGWKQHQAVRRPIEEVFNIVNEFTREKSENVVKKVIKSGKIFELANHTILISKDGTERPIEDSAAPIVQTDGEIVGVVLVFRDFSDKKQRQDEILYLSYHDQLTGLYNRRFYEEELKRLDIKRNLPLTLVMADVNGLKLINDSFGHVIGDKLLIKVSEVITKGCRGDDIIARLGGDEFVILLPNTDEFEAEQIIRRINVLAASEKTESIEVSVSFGYGTKQKDTENIEEIFKRAEDNMYRYKLYESLSVKNKTIGLIMNTLYEKSNREMLHSKRVSELCIEIATKMNFDKSLVNQIKIAGLIHDIGKIGIDEKIINKPEILDENEWKEIKRHSEIGYRLLSSSKDFLEIAQYVLEHHERWDGKGYPKGLKGEEISPQARIIALADAYAAMTSDSTYRKSLSEEEAIAEIKRCCGTQFDPEVVKTIITPSGLSKPDVE